MKNNRSFMETLVELLGWLRIAVSPILASAIGSFILMLSGNTLMAILVLILGIGIGVLWATSVFIKQGTVNFLAVNNTFSWGNTVWYRVIPTEGNNAVIELFFGEREELLDIITTILTENGFSVTNEPLDAELLHYYSSERGNISLKTSSDKSVYLVFDDQQLAKDTLRQFKATKRFRPH